MDPFPRPQRQWHQRSCERARDMDRTGLQLEGQAARHRPRRRWFGASRFVTCGEPETAKRLILCLPQRGRTCAVAARIPSRTYAQHRDNGYAAPRQPWMSRSRRHGRRPLGTCRPWVTAASGLFRAGCALVPRVTAGLNSAPWWSDGGPPQGTPASCRAATSASGALRRRRDA